MQAPDLVVFDATAPETANWGETVSVSWKVKNQSSVTAAANWWDHIYLSNDNIFDSSDRFIDSKPTEDKTLLAANSFYEQNLNIEIPDNTGIGSKYLLFIADGDDIQGETDNANNLKAVPIEVKAPDLVVSNITAPQEALSGQQIEISWRLTNQGNTAATGTWNDYIYLSSDSTVGTDRYITTFPFTGTIAAGESIERRQLITVPNELTGDYRIVVSTNKDSQIVRENQTNNTAIDDGAVRVRLSPIPNLQVSSVTAPPTAFSSQQTAIEWTVTNTGTGGTSAPYWYDAVWLSLDTAFDNTDTYLGSVVNASYLNVGESYINSLTVNLPRGIDGNYYFLVKTDTNNNVFERGGEGDNFHASDPYTDVNLTPPPDFQVAPVNAPSQGFSGQPLTLSWTVTNSGTGRNLETSWYDDIFMSVDEVLDNSDRFLDRRFQSGTINPGESYNATYTVTPPVDVSGDFFFFVRTDGGNQVYENAFEGNNTGYDTTATRINLTPPPDLEVEEVDAPASASASRSLTINYKVKNFGATATPNFSWLDTFYLSTDSQLNPDTDLKLGTQSHFGALDVDASYNGSATFVLPNAIEGTYYAFVVTDSANNVFELNNDNNNGIDGSPISITSRPADLAVTANIPITASAGKAIRVNWTVTNQGIGDTAVTNWIDRAIASKDAVLGNGDDVLLGTFERNGLLNPNSSYQRSELVTIPFELVGQYNLFAIADADGRVYEATNEINNSAVQIVNITRQTPDLQVTQVIAPATANSGQPFTVNWTVKNLGGGRTNTDYWYDDVYLSTDEIVSSDDIYLGRVYRSGALESSGQYTASSTFNLPYDISGDFYTLVRTDSTDRVVEAPLDNNNTRATVSAASIGLTPVPDLVVAAVDAPAAAISGQSFNVTWTVRNDGGAATVDRSWYDAFYLSRDQFFDRNTDTYLGFKSQTLDLAAGASYTQTESFTIPQGLSGPFYVFAVTDSGNYINERGGEQNNTGYDGISTEVQLSLPADLVVTDFTIPANGVPGQNATISYTVTNQGANPALGSWSDAIYLSTDEQWDVGDALVGRVQHFGDVPSAGTYSETLTAPLPGVVPGDYYVMVRNDIRNSILESNEQNNAEASVGQIAVDASHLELGIPVSGTMSQGQSVYYRVEVPEGETLQVTFDSAVESGFNELYVSYEQMPSPAAFDFEFENISADQQVVVPLTQAGTYYILARGQDVPTLTHDYSIEVETIDFGIRAIGQTVGDNSGTITVEISGAKFTSELTAVLENEAGEKVEATNIWYEDSTSVFATFDLTAATTGTYDLKILQPDYEVVYPETDDGNGEPVITTSILTDVLEDGFTVVDERPDNVLLSVTSTPSVRAGQSFDIIVSYANRGSHDVKAPLIVLETDPDIRLENIQDGDEFAQLGSMILLGISNEGPAGILRPGETGTIRLRGTAPGSTGSIDITARQMVDDGSSVDYASFIEYLGGDISTPEWSNAVLALQQKFGNSWTTFQTGLADLATELTAIDDYTHSATELWADVALDAWGKAYFDNFSTPSTENSLSELSSSIQLADYTAIENSLLEDNYTIQFLSNSVATESSSSEVNDNVQSFGFESSFQVSQANSLTPQPRTPIVPRSQIFETVEAIAQVFGYPDGVVGIKIPGSVEPRGRQGSAPESSFDFTITLNDIDNAQFADIIDDLAGVDPIVDVSSHALSVANNVNFDKNNIEALLALLYPYTDAFDTLMRRVENEILDVAEQFRKGLQLLRNPAPTAGAILKHFVGNLGSTPANLANSYEQSVRQALSAANPKAPSWLANKTIEIGQHFAAEWQTYRPTYPFFPSPTGHVHFDDNYQSAAVVPNVDLTTIPNNVVKDIKESDEYKSEINFLKTQLNLAVERGAFYVPTQVPPYD
ncbi:CARDB domain-containing protein [Argonema antarcticum]|uniref:CARDB domain-containing protein n=1 Tax=Argonema antarcticum TaxID=2942763 RepID=UPI002012E6BE|nr:CARDB domain-containing protein [Argonema antarcticum]MCL1475465.1 pre-peptidase C-terminal domain-containing protein [Argonema antarcticum A004/B2]